MRIYVFGGEKDACIELANQLNSGGASALIGKGEEDLKEVAAKIGKSYDCAIMISEDPIKAVVHANRDSRLRAAACYSQKSLKSAASENINLYVLDSDSVERLDFSALTIGSPAQPVQHREPVQHEIFKPTPAPKQKPVQKEQPVKKEQKKPEPEEEDEQESHPSRGGISGRIKDIFGIEE